MRAAVYDRHLSTAGGGERYAGMLAAVLAEEADTVDLVAHSETDLAALGDHLGLDLATVSMRVVPDRGDDALAATSAEYDLWVTSSYMSRLRPRAARNIYALSFPTPADHDLARWQRAVLRHVGDLSVPAAAAALTHGSGWFPPEGGRRRSWSWTNGDGLLYVSKRRGHHLLADIGRPGASEAAELDVVAQDGSVLCRLSASPAEFRSSRIPLPAVDGDLELRFVSGVFRPGPSDPRQLGVAVSRLRLEGVRSSVRERALHRFPWLTRAPGDLRFLDSYSLVLANSEFTRAWTQRWWGVDPVVLYPPVSSERVVPGGKAQRILSIGRFFAPDRGHSKKQLEMVRAFADLYRRGHARGWEYHLVGGCDDHDLPYVARVRAAAGGAPVHVHLNASRRVVEEQLCAAKVFWHAAGLGEHEDRKPWAFEHFGITTVEAMAAGAVPVVFDGAGQREIVRAGVDGFRFSTVAELEQQTLLLLADEALRSRLAASARESAARFSESAFRERWRGLLHSVAAPGG